MAFAALVKKLAKKVRCFRVHPVHLEQVNEELLSEAKLFLRNFKRRENVVSDQTSVSFRALFRKWLEDRDIVCQIDFDDGEDDVRFTHDMMILAAASLGVKLVPVKNSSMGINDNPSYKMNLTI